MNVEVIRCNRKTVGIRVNEDLTVTVRAPRRVSRAEIERILRDKEPWIRKHLERIKNEKAQKIDILSKDEIEELAKKAAAYIPERVEFFADKIGVDHGRITIRNQKTRWGSCSSNGNLNFNCLLMMTPPDVIDYVVVHELCHRKEMNHSRLFWEEVEKILPDYKKARQWLKNEGRSIMLRCG